ncbi:biopolymer transporter ExbD [Bacteroidia bacterium]|nr:biopolymer transporter ExbD [Bacteroidia bacterium]GHV70882.1 biopolymer transporter ExbD [Bacteroidia bacterium]
MAYLKRKIPQFNATSSADIAFILLLFFLLTGSLDPKSGIYRRLSPAASEAKLKKKTDIENRNLVTFSIDENNQIWMKDSPVALPEIRDIAKTFIANPNDLDFLPEKTPADIYGLGIVPVSNKAVIHLEFSRNTAYQTYISVLGELTAAYDDLRSELAFDKFHQPFNDLTEEQKIALREVYPQQISEKELSGKEVGDE